MKPVKLGMLSALTASVCCLGPLLLALIGLGSLGFGAFISRHHWWFITAAMVLLTFAWRNYLREVRRCRTEACEMAQGKVTRSALLLASVVVTTFLVINVYTYACQHGTRTEPRTLSLGTALTSVIIPVKGMTCFSCELTVESSLKHLPGVQQVDAKATEQAAHVRYDPAQIEVNALVAAINRSGFQAQASNEETHP
jgi:mercuric ion transport protein